MRQLALDIGALPIPAIQRRDGEAVPQVVQPGRSAALIQDPGRQAQQLPVPRQAVRTVRGLVLRAGVAAEQRGIRPEGTSAQRQVAPHFVGDGSG